MPDDPTCPSPEQYRELARGVPFEHVSKGLQRALRQRSVPPRHIYAFAQGKDGRCYMALEDRKTGRVQVWDDTFECYSLQYCWEPPGLRWKAVPQKRSRDEKPALIRRWWMFWLWGK